MTVTDQSTVLNVIYISYADKHDNYTKAMPMNSSHIMKWKILNIENTEHGKKLREKNEYDP